MQKVKEFTRPALIWTVYVQEDKPLDRQTLETKEFTSEVEANNYAATRAEALRNLEVRVFLRYPEEEF